ncbi:hypothetical protein HKX48_001880, partial [Thoreauomyces humboldtii]
NDVFPAPCGKLAGRPLNDISPPEGRWYAGFTPQAARKWVVGEAIALVRGYTRPEIKRWLAGIVASAAVDAVFKALLRRT